MAQVLLSMTTSFRVLACCFRAAVVDDDVLALPLGQTLLVALSLPMSLPMNFAGHALTLLVDQAGKEGPMGLHALALLVDQAGPRLLPNPALSAPKIEAKLAAS